MSDYRYESERGSKRHVCPSCGKKSFVRYVKADTGEYLPIDYGRCGRADNCAHHRNPYMGEAGGDSYFKQVWLEPGGSHRKESPYKRLDNFIRFNGVLRRKPKPSL